jgi:carboxymethylenebutenolidase
VRRGVQPSDDRHAPGRHHLADAFGLRPAIREMGKRLAGEGYAVLTVNPYYRVGQGHAARYQDVQLPERSREAGAADGSITADGAAEKDAAAFVAWLDTQKQVNASKKIGTQGYCMGGPLVMRTRRPWPTASAPARRSTAAAW